MQLPSQSSAPLEVVTVEEPQPRSESNRHIVQYGETLGTIAAAYGIDLNALIIENGIFGHIIYAGQVLILPGTTAPTASAPPESEPVEVADQAVSIVNQITYVIRPR